MRDPLDEAQSAFVRGPVEDHDKFHRDFWQEKVRWRQAGGRTPDGELALVIDGHHFVVGPERRPGYPSNFLGMGGRRFDILLEDGTTIITRNLWSQGDVPPDFRGQLPDNAKFVQGASVGRDRSGKVYGFDGSNG